MYKRYGSTDQMTIVARNVCSTSQRSPDSQTACDDSWCL